MHHRRLRVEARRLGRRELQVIVGQAAKGLQGQRVEQGGGPRVAEGAPQAGLHRHEAARLAAARAAGVLQGQDLAVQGSRQPARGVAGAHGAAGLGKDGGLVPRERAQTLGKPGAAQLDAVAVPRRARPELQRQGRRGLGAVAVGPVTEGVSHHAHGVAQTVQESDLEECDRRGLLAQVGHQLAVEHAEERGFDQRSQVLEQNGFGVEPHVGCLVRVGGRVVAMLQGQLSRNS